MWFMVYFHLELIILLIYKIILPISLIKAFYLIL